MSDMANNANSAANDGGDKVKPTLASVLKGENAKRTCVLVVDLQVDFMEKGRLAVGTADYANYLPECEAFIEKVRSMDPKPYIVFSQDWHPEGHSSFVTVYPGKEPFSTETLKRDDGTPYEQILWPEHCTQGSKGAEFCVPPKVDDGSEFVQQKGLKLKFDSYSAFMDAGDADTGLKKHLQDKGIDTVVGFGLATDFCVNFSVTDAAKMGFKTYWIPALSRGINPEFDEKKVIEEDGKVGRLAFSVEGLKELA